MNAKKLQFLCDGSRHLVCIPYSKLNLYATARQLKILSYWFAGDYLLIPEKRRAEIEAQCEKVTTARIIQIIETAEKHIAESKSFHVEPNM